ncbi:MAG: transposase [Verrucomicrobiales bacterium]|nr:transposase [Verrucomicrobiales bacterium]
MPRLLRIDFPGAVHHLVNRGNRGEPIFRDDADRAAFLAALGEVCGKTGWRVYAYVLQPDHFHVVLTTPQPNLVAGMKWWLGTYTNRFNRRHRLSGHLFGGRYRALLVDPDGYYLATVCDYVHLNPIRAGCLRTDQPLTDHRWSSLPQLLGVDVEDSFAWLIPARESPRELADRLEALRRGRPPEVWRRIRRGWCFGSAGFRSEIAGRLGQGVGLTHHGDLPPEAVMTKAEDLIRAGLAELGWTESDLAARPKMDEAKARLALRLRRETTLGLAWIARRLHLGSIHTARNVLARLRREESGSGAAATRPSDDSTPAPAAGNLTFDVRWD